MRKMFRDGIGYVEHIDHAGSESHISRMAGISHMSDKGASVEKLMRWGHMSPFEFASMTYKIKCPIFVARQMMRHRTGKYMEKSLRYCDATPEVYNPFPEGMYHDDFARSCQSSFEMYDLFVKTGVVDREQARGVLPVGMYTEFFVQFDVRNLLHFFDMRIDKDAQVETQWYAGAMMEIFEKYFPTIAKIKVDTMSQVV